MRHTSKAIFASGLVGVSVAASAGTRTLISRDLLFGNPERASVQISPDGSKLSFLAPVQGVMNIWVAPLSDIGAAKPVTDDRSRGIRQYRWTFTNDHIGYLQDIGGDEDWQLFVTDLTSGETKNLTPFTDIKGPDGQPMKGPTGKVLRPTARIQEVSHKFPNEILLGLNNRDPRWHDIHRLNIITGEMTLVQQNDSMGGFVTDDDYNVRIASRPRKDGGADLLKPDGKGGWTDWTVVPATDALTTSPIGFDATGQTLYWIESRGRDTAALVSMDFETGHVIELASHAKADIGGALADPMTSKPLAASAEYTRNEWIIIDKSIEGDFAKLRGVTDGDFSVTSSTLDNSKWVVAYVMDDGPVRYYLYDRKEKDAKFLFTNRPALENLELAKMHPVVIKSRDGLDLVSYLSLPPWTDTDNDARPDSAMPMVLVVHGGPWARDGWGLNPMHQWLTNRGYAVLSVNFRGSTGFGKEFINASNGEWAGKMHDDLLDAVDWAVKEKIAVKDKVAIMGGSYGGYATLVGLTFTPEKFACGVDIVGPSSLVTLLNTIPPYWQAARDQFRTRVGDLDTEAGRKLLEDRSPLNKVENIKRPLLIGQGANDPRVKQPEADQIVDAMKKKNIPVTYVLYPDEGHGFARPENRLSFFGVTEAFLSQHLGGEYEPIGDDFKGSSITVPEGAGGVPGLEGALEAAKK